MENADNPVQSAAKNNSPVGIILVVLAVILFAGMAGFFFLSQKKAPQKEATTTTMQPTPTATNAFTSIQDALSRSLSLQCDYQSSDASTTAYIKAGSVRADTTSTKLKNTSSLILKDKKVYMWSGTKGTMMTYDFDITPTVTPVAGKVTPTTQNPQDAIGMIEKYKESCKAATVDDALFVPPTNVTFTDMSKMMKSIPTVTGAMTQEQIKKLQEQYQQ